VGAELPAAASVQLGIGTREYADEEHPMTDTKQPLPRLRSVIAGPDYRVNVVWADEKAMTVDLSTVVKDGGVFAPLRDKDLFATVRIGERGRTLEWPDPRTNRAFIDFDADVLLRMGMQQAHRSLLDRFFQSILSRINHLHRPEHA
jgi:hypothetical protein